MPLRMDRSTEKKLPSTAVAGITFVLLLVIGLAGGWYLLLSRKADRVISPIASELSGVRYARFTLFTGTGAFHPAVQFQYDTVSLAPTFLPFVKVSILGDVIESNPESKWLETISRDSESGAPKAVKSLRSFR